MATNFHSTTLQAHSAAGNKSPDGGGNKQSDFPAVVKLLEVRSRGKHSIRNSERGTEFHSTTLQAQESATVPYKLPGLLMAVEGGHGLPSLTGPTILPGIHPHPIARSTRANEWRCDGCTSQGQASARYRSQGSGCDFDLCQNCWDAATVFKWEDVRAAPPGAGAAASKTAAPHAKPPGPLPNLQAVAADGYNTLPDGWRHDGWLPATARCRNTGRCGFPYLHLEGNAVLRSSTPMKVGTVFLVVRFPNAPAASCPGDAGAARHRLPSPDNLERFRTRPRERAATSSLVRQVTSRVKLIMENREIGC